MPNYTVKTVMSYQINGRTLQQTLTRYAGNDAVMAERMHNLCSPPNCTVERSTVDGKTTITIFYER